MRELLLELDVVVEVVVGQRVLVPVEAQLLDGLRRPGAPSGSRRPSVESSITVKPSPTARRTAAQISMSTSGSVGGWILYAVQPSALKRAASSA